MSGNLLRRGSRYSARLFVPADLREHVGRTEIVKSLGTGDRRHARLLLRGVQRIAERLFFYARIGMVDKGKLTALLTNYIEDALRDWEQNKGRLRAQEFDLSETVGGTMYLTGREQTTAEQFRAIADGVRTDYFVRERKEYVQEVAKILLKDNGLAADSASSEFDAYCDQLAKVKVKANEELANREEGRYSYDYRQFVEGLLAEDRPITLKQAIDEWIAIKQVKGLADGSMEMYRINADLALRFYGDDFPVRRLNNRELLRFVQNEQGRGIKNVTLLKRVRQIKDVVKLACANHGIPPHTYKIELKNDTADVKPYSGEELNQFFVLLSNKRKITDWKYWAASIGLLGGLRREEVVSLRVGDIKQDAGIWYFDITDAKSEAGIRYVPVSDILIRLGFIDFVQERKQSGETHLLMCWLPKPKREYVPVPKEKFSDFFDNLKKKVKITVGPGEKKDLHSLRHNYSDALKQGGVRPDITDELCGHVHAPGSMRSIYDEKFGLTIMHFELNRAKWECDFSLLRTWKG